MLKTWDFYNKLFCRSRSRFCSRNVQLNLPLKATLVWCWAGFEKLLSRCCSFVNNNPCITQQIAVLCYVTYCHDLCNNRSESSKLWVVCRKYSWHKQSLCQECLLKLCQSNMCYFRYTKYVGRRLWLYCETNTYKMKPIYVERNKYIQDEIKKYRTKYEIYRTKISI